MPSQKKQPGEPPFIADDETPRPYSLNISLERLKPGTDNLRYDVLLSPDICRQIGDFSLHLLIHHSQAEKIWPNPLSGSLAEKKESLQQGYQEIMLAAINKAKETSEIQLDHLVQLAAIKMIQREIRVQFDTLINTFNNCIWEYEASKSRDPRDVAEIKERLASIRLQRRTIISLAGKDLFGAIHTVHQQELQARREAVFGPAAALPIDLFANPLLLVDQPTDEFMLDEYVLLGHRADDIDRYDQVLALLRGIYQETANEQADMAFAQTDNRQPDAFIMQVDNIDRLFNYQLTETKIGAAAKDTATLLEKQASRQRNRLVDCLRKFEESGLIDRIVAAQEIKKIFRQYCPPLVPQQLLGYLLVPQMQKNIVSQLERHRSFYGKPFTLQPLQETGNDLSRFTLLQKQEFLLQFLRGFCRYHRDLTNSRALREVLERINLATEERIIRLSRANHTLYEYMLVHEQEIDLTDDRSLNSHVIIKADVRGAEQITRKLSQNGLNPASYFSLNFFEPVTDIIPEYGATKVFVRGDAIILTIAEPGQLTERFEVARACGLALNILNITRKHNSTCATHQLPALEVGCGISFLDSAPAFLFDGANRIMISSAINQADRLAGCSTSLRRLLASRKRAFNLYVFQLEPPGAGPYEEDELLWRYNVNGIELNAAAFARLSEEIDLQRTECNISDFNGENKVSLYSGTFPTVSGKYQQLVIRAGEVLAINSANLETARPTGQSYYEVTSHPKLYEFARKRR
ncbi:MAG: hypothetical protein A2521_16245 [Deltaproteobacteria bacterium RIFOXYD12_FULL_57_12]|nr:MAG: hypothetical protein A2521_16245 [Deltaproteobacteria bacterium RIFOXYD12_FULL_57_12]